MKLEVGMFCKHFKGQNLIEKNIYEILAINVSYTGNNNVDLSNMVIYRPLFQEDKYFAREYDDLVQELSLEEQELYKQTYRIEALTEDELKMIGEESFIREKLAYTKEKYAQKKL